MTRRWSLCLAVVMSLTMVASVRADFCIQLSENLSGSLGFLKFKGQIPKKKGKFSALTGRRGDSNDYGPAYGGASVLDDGTCMNLSAQFVADGDPGAAILEFCPSGGSGALGVGSVGDGQSTYGTTPAWSSETGTIVSCP
jgi:hypothetical protein